MSINAKIEEKFQRLLEEGQRTLAQAGWDGKEYHRFPNDIDYRRFRTEALNLIKRVCGEESDHYQELKRLAENERTSGNAYFYKDCYGVLQAAYRDYEDGLCYLIYGP